MGTMESVRRGRCEFCTNWTTSQPWSHNHLATLTPLIDCANCEGWKVREMAPHELPASTQAPAPTAPATATAGKPLRAPECVDLSFSPSPDILSGGLEGERGTGSRQTLEDKRKLVSFKEALVCTGGQEAQDGKRSAGQMGVHTGRGAVPNEGSSQPNL